MAWRIFYCKKRLFTEQKATENHLNNKSQLVSSEVIAEHFNVVDNIIYYYNNGMIYSLNVENMEIKDIVKINGGDTFINVADDKIFYLDDLQIYKTSSSNPYKRG